MDDETDIAVLRVERAVSRPSRSAIPTCRIRAGVPAFGSPLGLQNSVSLGIVSAVARQLEPESPMVYIQTDASINPEQPGPLVDARGRLMGINTLILRRRRGRPGFAAPSNIVRTVFEQIRKTGRVRRGEIGVRAQTVTPYVGCRIGPQTRSRSGAGGCRARQPCRQGRLSVGDLVPRSTAKLWRMAQLQINLYRREVGETVKLEVLRGDQPTTVTVSVAERADPLSAAALLNDLRENVAPRLGILAATLDPVSGHAAATKQGRCRGGLSERERT